jgi:dinuclear metal center YbgI/SA1388 family protein
MGNALTTSKLDMFFRGILDFEKTAAIDKSLNGIQVDNGGREIEKIAFAVDSSLECFKRAADAGAGMVFAHHGLFWGAPLRVSGGHRERIKFLLDHDIALYAAHLPLDMHPDYGNNAALAELVGLEGLEPFGAYHGVKVGFKGRLKAPLSVDDAVKRIAFMGRPPVGVFPFGKEENRTAAVISGGAAFESLEAIDEGVDLYVTGEGAHECYHQWREAGINVIAGGHYATEVWGVRRMREMCGRELGLDTEFIDIPTGL